jgi:hypothetical protein
MNEPGNSRSSSLKEFAVPSLSQQPLAPFASLPTAAAREPGQFWAIARLFTAPFYDVDQRVLRKAVALKAARDAAMSDAAERRRF